ncbi:MAG: ABC transporter permease [Coriobacteriales bacterium]|nr:ABC transporter permease [Coriobacteriales bacterium]
MKSYYLMTFRNPFLLVSHYVLPIAFYLLFSIVLTAINETAKSSLIIDMAVFAILMSSYIGLPGSVTRYVHGDIKKAYCASRIRLWHVFLSIGINNIVHCIIVTFVISATAPMIFGATTPNFVSFFLAVSLGIVSSTLIGLLIGMCSKSESISIVVSQLFFLPSIFLSGIMFDDSLLPDSIREISFILPAKHILSIYDNTVMQTFFPLIILIVIVLLVLFARYRFILNQE